jgi:protein-S-isoprenylcysteine O-methyltransferase Ste14
MSSAVSALIVLGATIVYGLVHSLLASLHIKEWARKRFGEAAGRGYRLGFNIFAGLTLLPVLALPALLPDRALYSIPFPWTLLTLALQGLAALALLCGLIQTGLWSFLGLQQLMAPLSREGGELVVHGLYRWVRHPLYTAGLVFIWLTPVMTVNLLALIAGFSFYLVIGALIEERKLLEEFGQAYAEYRRRTSFLIPLPPRMGL